MRFTESCKVVAGDRCQSGQLLAARARTTARERCLIAPVLSATGMNAPGGSRPRVGCCQYVRSSKPTMLPRRELDLRLEVRHELAASRSVAQLRRRGRAARDRGGRPRGCRRGPRPATVFAVCIATSACRRSVSASSPSVGNTADADARVHRERDAVDDERSLDGRSDPLGERRTLRPRSRTRGRSRTRLRPSGPGACRGRASTSSLDPDLPQDSVAGVLPERVVDLTEVVEVYEEDG